MYELGDKVIYQGVDEKVYKKHGVVKSIEEKHGKPQLTVELENGETFTAPIDDWSREFSNACTSTNAVIRNAVAAKNATIAKPSDPESAKRLDAFWRKVSALKREAEELDKFLVSRKQYGYSGSLSYIARALADD